MCCASEVVDLANGQQQARIRGLMTSLAKAPRGQGASDREATQALQQQFVAEVACEDPRNGEVTVRMVDLPFVFDSDQEQQALWAM